MILTIPTELKYVLDRGSFEYKRSISNMVFLINQHLEDEDDSFLSSELYERNNDKMLEKLATNWCYEIGVLGNMLDSIPMKYKFLNSYESVMIEGEN